MDLPTGIAKVPISGLTIIKFTHTGWLLDLCFQILSHTCSNRWNWNEIKQKTIFSRFSRTGQRYSIGSTNFSYASSKKRWERQSANPDRTVKKRL